MGDTLTYLIVGIIIFIVVLVVLHFARIITVSLFLMGKEPFAVSVDHATVYNGANLDENGFFIGLTPEKLLENAGLVGVTIATQEQIERFTGHGMQTCSWSTFVQDGKLRAGYPIQNAQPGSCEFIPGEKKPTVSLSGAIAQAAPWNIIVYGEKPAHDAIDLSVFKGRTVWPFYTRAAGGDNNPEVWSFYDQDSIVAVPASVVYTK